MWINSSYITEQGVTPKILAALISRHQTEQNRYEMLLRYYKGEHDILKREKNSDTAANNKLTANQAKYITDMSTAFFNGVPVEYSTSDEYDISPIREVYQEQTISGLDSKLEKNASIYGRAYELVFANSENAPKPRSTLLPPQNAFVVYDDTAEHNKLFGVYYYNQIKLDGSIGAAEVQVVDSMWRTTLRGKDTNFSNLEAVKSERHYFCKVPMIEYMNNDEGQGDFEQQKSLIDAYNILMSDRINDKEQFVDAILFLVNVLIDTETVERLKTEKILEAVPGSTETAKAEYLCKSLTEADVEILRKALKEDIQQYSMVPNLSDEKFAGNSSGVALLYKLLGFQQHVKNKEPLFAKGLRERFELYNNFLTKRGDMKNVPTHKIDIKFSRNLPSNELELSQIVNNLRGIVSDETLMELLPFIPNAKDEILKMRKQKDEDAKQRVAEEEKYMSATSYNKSEEDLDNELE